MRLIQKIEVALPEKLYVVVSDYGFRAAFSDRASADDHLDRITKGSHETIRKTYSIIEAIVEK